MKGLELSRKFFDEFGAPMLQKEFFDLLPFIAVGLAGSGSECYGFDDELSRDHDFEPAFCIFIPDQDIIDQKTAFALERAYEKLPSEFMGVKRNPVAAVGGNRHGVIRIDEFFGAKTGKPDGNLTLGEWFSLPESMLCEATNGEIFIDNLGLFSDIRKMLSYYPEDIAQKKLAGNLLLMGQAGQYNYSRCLVRGDMAAAQLAVFEFVKHAMNAVFLLNKTYMPYYKWSFCALKKLPILSHLADSLEFLISSANDADTAIKKQEIIESVCNDIANEVVNSQSVAFHTAEMERLAYMVNDKIADGNIRNLNILCGIR